MLIPEEAAPQFLDDAAPRNGMMPPADSEMIAPPITECPTRGHLWIGGRRRWPDQVSSFHRGCERQFSRVYQAKNLIVARAASSATAIAPMRIVMSRTAN